MADIREELASAIAEKYLELDEIAKQVGAYGAIRLDWARYGEDGLDQVLESFRAGLEEFDRNLSGVMGDGEFVKNALENIMDEREMDDEQRYKFLSTVKTFSEQAGEDRLISTLSGENDNVLRALMHMSEVKLCDVKNTEHAGEVLDDICRAAQAHQDAIEKMDIRNVSGETAEELLRCYAAYCVLREGKIEGLNLNGDCLKFIGCTVKAGQKQAEILRDKEEGKLTGDKAAEVLRAIAEVLLVALALFISGGMGAYAAISVMRIVGLLIGFTGALGGFALALGLIGAIPMGVVVTCDMLKLCAKAGVWLEKSALEPGAVKVAEFVDNTGKWLSESVAPSVKQGWDNACTTARGAYESVRPQVEKTVADARAAADTAWKNVQPQVQNAADGALKWMERAGGELDSALGKLFKAFNLDDGRA